MAGSAGVAFDQQTQAARAQAVDERLHQPPGEEARREVGLEVPSPPPSRWSVRAIRASVEVLAPYSRSGVWRLLQRLHLQRRPLRAQLYSPDPDYAPKLAHRERCVREAARWPQEVVVLFLDERGDSRWPAGACDWMLAGPGVAASSRHKAGPTNRQQRLIGALNALIGALNALIGALNALIGALNARTGQVEYLDNYLVGRFQVSAFYRRLDAVYPAARRIYVVQDNWSIHHHPDVLATLRQLPRLQPVWLPTYAPWLNPIEKLWHWRRRDVLNAHRLAADWPQVRHHVNAFLEQFAHGSPALLR